MYCGSKEPAINRKFEWKSVRPFYTCLKVTAGKHCSTVVYMTVNLWSSTPFGEVADTAFRLISNVFFLLIYYLEPFEKCLTHGQDFLYHGVTK